MVAGAQSLAAAGAALHPGLRLDPAPPGPAAGGGRAWRTAALFLCTGNSARSQAAEALVRARSCGLGGSNEVTYPAFERMAAELETRIGFWLATISDPPAQASLEEAR